MQTFMLFIGTITLVIGVKLIYDARLIVNKYFSVSQKNTAVIFLKVLGTFCAVLGAILISKNWGAMIN
ncbi:MAG: hypothetical protein IJ629_01025 [Clostridia bacterium]|nr:hypothetical protein [Clostridia bacterium]